MKKAPNDRRDRIVESAMKLFIAQGVGHTRLAEIAKHAKVDPQLLQYHFPDLDSLYAEVGRQIIDHYVGYMHEKMVRAEDAPPLKVLKSYVLSYFKWAEENPGIFTLLLHFYYLASFKEAFTLVNQESRTTGRQRIENMLYKCFEFGELRKPDGVPVAELAADVQTIMIGGIIGAMTEKEMKPAVAGARAWRAIARWMGSSG
jgi:AcrR family transcriptional regulator